MNELQRITDYLASGGLFNPDLANHDAVRDLLIDCRDRIEELEGLLRETVPWIEDAVELEGGHKPKILIDIRAALEGEDHVDSD